MEKQRRGQDDKDYRRLKQGDKEKTAKAAAPGWPPNNRGSSRQVSGCLGGWRSPGKQDCSLIQGDLTERKEGPGATLQCPHRVLVLIPGLWGVEPSGIQKMCTGPCGASQTMDGKQVHRAFLSRWGIRTEGFLRKHTFEAQG